MEEISPCLGLFLSALKRRLAAPPPYVWNIDHIEHDAPATKAAPAAIWWLLMPLSSKYPAKNEAKTSQATVTWCSSARTRPANLTSVSVCD